jgi:hypothetical protein
MWWLVPLVMSAAGAALVAIGWYLLPVDKDGSRKFPRLRAFFKEDTYSVVDNLWSAALLLLLPGVVWTSIRSVYTISPQEVGFLTDLDGETRMAGPGTYLKAPWIRLETASRGSRVEEFDHWDNNVQVAFDIRIVYAPLRTDDDAMLESFRQFGSARQKAELVRTIVTGVLVRRGQSLGKGPHLLQARARYNEGLKEELDAALGSLGLTVTEAFVSDLRIKWC